MNSWTEKLFPRGPEWAKMQPLDYSQVMSLKELYSELGQKYVIHRAKIERVWRSFTPSQRAAALKFAAGPKGKILQHRDDQSLEDLWKLVPELNLRAIAGGSSTYFLRLLKHRSTVTLRKQYSDGPGGPNTWGDHTIICKSIEKKDLRPKQRRNYCVSIFLNEHDYGRSYKASNADDFAEVCEKALAPLVNIKLCQNQHIGELIMSRQRYFARTFNAMVDFILDESRHDLSGPKNGPKEPKLTIEDLELHAANIQGTLLRHLALLRDEPTYLADALQRRFRSRPELLPDDRGRQLPLQVGKHVTVAFFELLHEALAMTTNWAFMLCLLEDISQEPATEKARRGVLLQEIANFCQFEYTRAQASFIRQVQSSCGSKSFRRVAGASAMRGPKVSLKVDPQTLVEEDLLLHHVLKLCQLDMTHAQAVIRIRELDNLIKTHASEMNRLSEPELDAFSDFAAAVYFIQALQSALALPPLKKKDQVYGPKYKLLWEEVDVLKDELDLSNLLVPEKKLLQPGMAAVVLQRVETHIINRTGTRISLLYEDLMCDCVEEVEERCARVNDLQGQQSSASEGNVGSKTLGQPSREELIRERRERDIIREKNGNAAMLSPLAIIPSPVPADDSLQEPSEGELVTVKHWSSCDTLQTLLSTDEPSGGLAWSDFVAAIEDLGFSLETVAGSLWKISPPEGLAHEYPITLHRPHGPIIEESRRLFIAARLRHLFRWTERSFVAA